MERTPSIFTSTSTESKPTKVRVRRATLVNAYPKNRNINVAFMQSSEKNVQERRYKKIIPPVADDPSIINFGGVNVKKALQDRNDEEIRMQYDLESEFYNAGRPRSAVCRGYGSADYRGGICAGRGFDPIGRCFQGIGNFSSAVVSATYDNKKGVTGTATIAMDRKGIQCASGTVTYAKTITTKSGKYLFDVSTDATYTHYMQNGGGHSLCADVQVSRNFQVGGENKMSITPYIGVNVSHTSQSGSGKQNCISASGGVTGSYTW